MVTHYETADAEANEERHLVLKLRASYTELRLPLDQAECPIGTHHCRRCLNLHRDANDLPRAKRQAAMKGAPDGAQCTVCPLEIELCFFYRCIAQHSPKNA
jgi:hypothetical protein